jgi:hypothetical protein
MDAKRLAAGAAAFRALFGVALFAAPSKVGGMWIGPGAQRPETHTPLRAMGGRDIALGAGTLAALRNEDRPDVWLGAGAFSDSADLVATLAARNHIPAANWAPTLVFIALSTAANAALAAALSD